jgi:molecular chaperone Hsp33
VADAPAAAGGELRRFMLEKLPVRGFWIRLDEAWRELRRHQHYAPSVERLLGEAVGASVLLAATLKFQGTLTLQLMGDGLVSLLVAQCTHDLSIRAVARAPEIVVGDPGFRQLVGEGRLSVTVEADERAARYQGIVALEGRTLAECIENYFATSEQLPTRIALSADGERGAGLLLQRLPLPAQAGESAAALAHEAWEHLSARAAALDEPLLRLGSAEQVLQRVCGEYDCRLFAGAPVNFVCRCDVERVRNVLRSLGVHELRSIIDEQGTVSVTCEFCGRPYRFDAIDVEGLFALGGGPDSPQSLN